MEDTYQTLYHLEETKGLNEAWFWWISSCWKYIEPILKGTPVTKQRMSEFAEQMQNKEKIKFITAKVSKYFLKKWWIVKNNGFVEYKGGIGGGLFGGIAEIFGELSKFGNTSTLFGLCLPTANSTLQKVFYWTKKNSNLSFLQNISNASHKTRVWQNSSWMTRMTLLQTFSDWWISSREKSCAMHCWEWRSAIFSAHSWWDISMDTKKLL